MADGTQLNPGAAGDIISTDDLGGGVKVQRNKVQYGDDGSATDVSRLKPLPARQNGTTAVVTSVAALATSAVILVANAERVSFVLYNDSAVAVNIVYGLVASAALVTERLLPYGRHSWLGYSGPIAAIWDNAVGNMRITEVTL